jgi:hypothetical protein
LVDKTGFGGKNFRSSGTVGDSDVRTEAFDATAGGATCLAVLGRYFMKSRIALLSGACGWMAGLAIGWMPLTAVAEGSVVETAHEFVAVGDFDGDGRLDVVVADKATGRYRVAYQPVSGLFEWATVRNAGLTKVTGFTIGRLLDPSYDALAFTSPDAGEIYVVDARLPEVGVDPVSYYPATLGPSALVAVRIGGEGSVGLDDLVVGSVYNVPEPYRLDLLRNLGGDAEPIEDFELEGEVRRASRVQLKAGGSIMAAGLIRDEEQQVFQVASLEAGVPEIRLTMYGLSRSAEYVVGRFGGRELATVLIYEPGQAVLRARPVVEDVPGWFRFGREVELAMEEPILQVYAVGPAGGEEIVVVMGRGEAVGVYEFDGQTAPQLRETIRASGVEYWSGVADLGDRLMLLSRRQTVDHTSRWRVYRREGGLYVAEAAAADLTTWHETDVEIHRLIMANLTMTDPAGMQAYTNTIPGSKVNYAMVPIPGGEFVMGSPGGEDGRRDDEGPKVRVRIDPFWMGQFEVTWDEYELFMYPGGRAQVAGYDPDGSRS